MELLESLDSLWTKQIELSRKAKKRQFGETAEKLWSFLGKSYRQLYLEVGKDTEEKEFPRVQGPYYKPRLNKSAEFVSLMAPYVLAKIPHRLVSPRRPEMPMEIAREMPDAAARWQQLRGQDQLRAWLLQWWANYLPTEYDLYREARTALPEALVKGRGVVWHEMTESSLGLVPASFYETIDGTFIDPDCQQHRDAAYLFRERKRPAWRLADQFGIDVKKLRAQARSNFKEALDATSESQPEEEQGDICTYYEVWSRMGPGHKLFSVPDDLRDQYELLSRVGPYVWLAIMPGLGHPLNLRPEDLQTGTAAELKARLEWPIAFHEEIANPWPCSFLDFEPHGHDPWATSPLEKALPLQIFLDHLYAFIFGRIRSTCRDLIITASALSERLKKAIEGGLDQEIVEIEGVPADDVPKLVHILQFPALTEDTWRIIPLAERAFERATAMDPLIYGGESQRQMRSAREADVREAHLTTRPDDLADCVENWMSGISAKECQATRLHVPPPYELFGEDPPQETEQGDVYSGSLSQAWIDLVNTNDPAVAASELSYTVEAGAGRRQNKQKQMADIQQLSQALMPFFLQLAMDRGMVEPYNAFMEMLGQAYDRPMQRLMLQAPPQPEAPE